MSFILDALKKSERERQRQTGPALFEVKVAPPRSRLPIWAVVIGVLLAVNFGVVIWLLLRNGSSPENTEVRDALAANAPPVAAPVQASRPQAPIPAPFPPGNPSIPALDTSNRPSPSLNGNPPDEGVLNSEDYEPAREPPQNSMPAREPDEEPSPARNTSGVMSYQEVASNQSLGVPELRLDLHVYDPEPGKSFVLVNMQKLRQGDSFGNGVRVDNITANGAILSYRGVQFLLRQQ